MDLGYRGASLISSRFVFEARGSLLHVGKVDVDPLAPSRRSWCSRYAPPDRSILVRDARPAAFRSPIRVESSPCKSPVRVESAPCMDRVHVGAAACLVPAH